MLIYELHLVSSNDIYQSHISNIYHYELVTIISIRHQPGKYGRHQPGAKIELKASLPKTLYGKLKKQAKFEEKICLTLSDSFIRKKLLIIKV